MLRSLYKCGNYGLYDIYIEYAALSLYIFDVSKAAFIILRTIRRVDSLERDYLKIYPIYFERRLLLLSVPTEREHVTM